MMYEKLMTVTVRKLLTHKVRKHQPVNDSPTLTIIFASHIYWKHPTWLTQLSQVMLQHQVCTIMLCIAIR